MGIMRRILRVLRERRGISTSLIEAGAVIGVGITLAAAFAPTVVGVADEGKVARAASETGIIRDAIRSFFADTQEFPVRLKKGTFISRPLQAAQTAVVVTLLTTGTSDFTKQSTALLEAGTTRPFTPGQNNDPLVASTLKDVALTLTDSVSMFVVKKVNTLAVSNLNQQLRPGNLFGYNNFNANGYLDQEVGTDPWGRNYVVLAQGYYIPSQKSSTTGTFDADDAKLVVARVCSAGPNGVLETGENNRFGNVGGDDVCTEAAFTTVTAAGQ